MDVEPDITKFKSANYSTSSKVLNSYCITDDVNTVIVEEEKDAEKFMERHYLQQEELEYPRDRTEPGLVLIFNQQRFKDPDEYRRGSRRDVNEIVLCLQRFGYNIHLKNIHSDLKKDEIINKVQEVCEMEDLIHYNCLIVFVLTHGCPSNQIQVRDDTMEAGEIWTPFATCTALKNKPKMFVFQACKGEKFSTTMNIPERRTSSKLVPPIFFSSNVVRPDMLIVNSTVEGHISLRNVNTGSWFIQELCKNIYAYGRRDDVISILLRTTKCVSYNYFWRDSEDLVLKKEMPVVISTLKKKFYLNRNKDRDFILKMIKRDEELIKDLEKIKVEGKKKSESKTLN